MFVRWSDLAVLGRAHTATIRTTVAVHHPRIAIQTAELFKQHVPQLAGRPGLSAVGRIVADLANQAALILNQRAQLEMRSATSDVSKQAGISHLMPGQHP